MSSLLSDLTSLVAIALNQLKKMCRICALDASSQSTSSESCSPHYEDKLLGKLYKVRQTQDLERHCGMVKRGIHLLEMQKVTGLGGTLSQQLFEALDCDQDGLLGRKEFTEGILRLCKGSEEDKFRILFAVVDFNGKGFVTVEDLRSILLSLPTICSVCGQRLVHSWVLVEVLADLFRTEVTHSYASLWEIRARLEVVTKDIIDVIVNSLPAALLDIMHIPNRHICESRPHPASLLQACNLRHLKFEGRGYFFTLRKGCLFGYTSPSAELPKVLIFAKDLFVSLVGETQFALGNCSTVYNFTACCPEDRDHWVDSIAEDQHFRWFDDFYETGELLGQGGQAKVFGAVSRGARLPVAVKIISKEGLQTKNEARVRREICILRLSNHPNVMQLYDVFESSERFYLVTEVFHEGTLFSWLEKRNFQVSEFLAKSIFTNIARGLQYLHERGVVHRDLKLENVLLRQTKTGPPEAVLIDFGMSCFLGPEQCSTEPVGTLKYAAPEVISRLPYGCKADCWSLGVILYVLLAGRMPFYGRSEQHIAEKILRRPISVCIEKWGSLSPAAKAVVQGLLTREAASRWGLKEALESQWLTGETATV